LRSHVRLPHDAFLLVPCPISIGGLLVLAGSSVVYLHTSARRVNLAVSGWAAREAPSGADGDVVMNAEEDAEAGRDMDLNGARAAFVDDRTALLVFRTGVVHVITLNTEGADVVSISLGPPLARTSCPTLLHACFHADEHGAQAAIKHLFVGSTTGESTILDVKWQEDEVYGSAVVQESRVEDSTRQENVPSVAMVEDEDAGNSTFFFMT
jgi:cleavage and polyadenylation specificity factor subunit 1